MTPDIDYGRPPLHQALRRKVDAALSLPPGGLPHAACDTLQRAVDTVCGDTLSGEWADLFVLLVGKTADRGDRPQRVLELARTFRTLVDRARKEAWAAVARVLCAEGLAVGDRVPPLEVVRQMLRWIDLPEGRLVLQAYSDYEGKCRPRELAEEVRRAVVALLVGDGDVGPCLPAGVLAETLQTAGEFGIPPCELSLELRELAALLPAPLSPALPRYTIDDGVVRQFREKEFSVSHLVALYQEHHLPASGPVFRAWLPTLLANGLTEGPMPGLLLASGFRPPGAVGTGTMSQKTWDGLLQIVRAVQPHGTQALDVVFGHLRGAADLEKQVRPLGDLVRAWAARPGATVHDLRTAIQLANVRQDGHNALLAAAGIPNRMTPAESNAFFFRYMSDHPPFAEKSPEAAKYREKTFDVIRRLHNVSHGFGALKVVNQRMPDGGPSAYDEFGDDLFTRLDLVNASSNELFPGFGYVFVGPQMERIFAHDLSHPSDPLHRYKAAWTDPNRLRSTHLDLDRFADAEFTFVRGFVAVSVPEGDFAEQYEVAGTPLTLLVWNNHFPTVEGELAMLVPTSLYRERIAPCLIRCTEMTEAHPDSRDACRARLDPESLRAECAERSLPFVDLGSPSVAGGGLVNGFPARKPPYHQWEADLPAYETRDMAGHVHKSHILGGYRTRLKNDSELDRALQPLRDGNDRVFDIASSYLNLLDIFFLCFATWHRGDTLDAIDFEGVFDDDDQQQLAEAEDDDDEPFNPRNTRILMTAYQVHDQLIETRAPRSAFRVYCTANPLHLYPQPEGAITLDTFDMKLTVRGPQGRREISLARDQVGPKERAEMLWVRHVLAYLRQTGFDFRPYDHAAVAGLLADSPK